MTVDELIDILAMLPYDWYVKGVGNDIIINKDTNGNMLKVYMMLDILKKYPDQQLEVNKVIIQ